MEGLNELIKRMTIERTIRRVDMDEALGEALKGLNLSREQETKIKRNMSKMLFTCEGLADTKMKANASINAMIRLANAIFGDDLGEADRTVGEMAEEEADRVIREMAEVGAWKI